ncbi:MAG: Transposase [Candidatus Falkowbacteria bacterium GW2011_GWC2_38_22]|uniref:Transposase n=1 Tax=Candidatus Falkowbacteria bacterium GW2011_GWE1_38_31 TaxID=1618638 RepID=A0A0G0MZA6_9BACT|nr:MAG: Transposase [Candidatus Falkowbacteria bacterium GW2011_GWF2_38_1205]KKQ61064.1 MAG: Transposase [Candidatus Falkowbacteria bacterium GW2011_GWC2_38_22]KKQ63407.1 MAG: Transposase [Candidatus Falkowbacteria bacterium GW2011_GWF1_38_22]KKQ65522.1 MAG: Transposase [Candidatus Falkowbacteria bacterium GW2011_GWE2_38_254]KKQ70171.1 MAG: Transposase [Candidatus Falkowbacteria bacterium GW2011_GWE1_38_31]KKQ72653.1 MAG: Transposase [Candidatus Falkowbacteria bacterium GW2011_GWD2_38_42]HAM8
MNRRIFNSEQIANLLKNPYVSNCSSKAITYSKIFKISAVKQYYEDGLPARHIFLNAGFDLGVIGDNPRYCLKRWKKTFKSRGIDGLAKERRGASPTGRPRIKEMTDAEKINRLEATVAYLRAENDFLIKLRALRKS